MGFGNLGIWEILIISVLVLIFFGPRRLPEIARSAGKAIREFKRGLNEIQRELELAEEEERRRAPPPDRPDRDEDGDRPGRIAPEPSASGEASRPAEASPRAQTSRPAEASRPAPAEASPTSRPEAEPEAGTVPASGADSGSEAGKRPSSDPRQSDLFGSAAQG